MLSDIVQDLRYAFRSLRNSPLFTLVAVLTLALGIGSTATLFAVVDAVLLRPLPFPDAGALVSISEFSGGHDQLVASSINIAAWQGARSFTGFAAYTQASAALTGQGDPVQLVGSRVAPGFFGVLGVPPLLGRTLQPSDTAAGAPPVTLLGQRLWRERFGGDSNIIGRSIRFDDTPTVVVGVVRDLDDISTATFWQPLRLERPSGDGAVFYYEALARLRPGVTVDAARHELAALAERVDATRAQDQRGSTSVIMSLHDRFFGSIRNALQLLFGAGLFLLLIACANVANLLLARAAARRREVAVRLALGASRSRLIRQIVAESALLSLLGAGAGMLIPVWAVGIFTRLSPERIGRLAQAHTDLRVIAFAAAIALATGLVFGAIPAWIATRDDALDSLKETGVRSTGSIRQHQVRRMLVAAELATALVLLTGAGLLTRSFLNAVAVDPGFHADHLLGARIYLSRDRYPSEAAQRAFFTTLVERVKSLPGVRSAAMTDAPPSNGFAMSTRLSAFGRTADSTPVAIDWVGREYPRTIDLGLVAGRWFDSTDANPPASTALLSARAAHALYQQGNAVGQLLQVPQAIAPGPIRIVGIVKDAPQAGVEGSPIPRVYVLSDAGRQSVLMLRASGDAVRLEPTIRHIVSGIDPLQPVAAFVDVDRDISRAFAPRRLNFLLFDVFAAIAMFLAGVGVYGVMAFQVAQRTREIGIRIALGATGRAVRLLILSQGMTMVAAGCVTGLVLSAALSRLLAGLLFGVGTHDMMAFLAAPLALCLIAAVACYLPARRASRVDPVVALRNE